MGTAAPVRVRTVQFMNAEMLDTRASTRMLLVWAITTVAARRNPTSAMNTDPTPASQPFSPTMTATSSTTTKPVVRVGKCVLSLHLLSITYCEDFLSQFVVAREATHFIVRVPHPNESRSEAPTGSFFAKFPLKGPRLMPRNEWYVLTSSSPWCGAPALAGYDGGDCCSCTCTDAPEDDYQCGGNGFNCVDPGAPCMDGSQASAPALTLSSITWVTALLVVFGVISSAGAD